jgi:hypothetical protein
MNSAWAQDPGAKVVDETGLLNLLQGAQRLRKSSFGAAGQSICAAGRTLREESATTQQDG